ncbi:MAG: 2OG-Fe(II) oxygenase [Limnohabitans sp.]
MTMPTTWPVTRVVATLPGSLPMGGVVPETPIHAFVQTPACLALGPQPALHPTRQEIDLGGPIAFMIRDVVTAQEAQAIIDASEVFGYRDEAPGISTPPGMRMNKSVHWLADDALLGPLMQRIAPLLPTSVDGRALYGQLSHRLNMYRYDDNDVFNRHIDGDWPGYSLDDARATMVEWTGVRSALTMILYLNDPSDGVEGGNTRLLAKDGRWVDVVPAKGSALFFRHGFTPDSVIHIGDRVRGPVAKYVARINVMFV